LSVSAGIRTAAATLAAITSALLLASGPANAAVASARGSADASADTLAEACWLNADDGRLQCFADDAELEQAMLSQTGAPLVELVAAPPSATPTETVARANYVFLRIYDGGTYSGSSTTLTTANSAICTTGPGPSGTFPTGWNDRVSSYHSYLSCTTRVYVNAGQSGTYYGYSIDAPGLGIVDNLGSSYSSI
jgi:hypothetical protein